jgi:hypothetical protein
MSPIEELTFKDIQARSAEKWRIASLPKFDPITGKQNPWVVTTREDKEIKVLLGVIEALHDEVARLEELVEKDEMADLLDEEHPEG